MMVPKFRAWIKTGIETYDYVSPMTIQQMIHSKKSTFSLEQLNDLVDFEQFTGIKDAKGKEIYENDIVKVFAVDDPEDYYHAPIKYWIDDNYPAFDIDTKYVPSTRWYDANILSTISESGYEKMEVVGNVHENPELLEAQHGN